MVVLLLFMVPECFLVSVATNYRGDGRVTLLNQGWKQASKKVQVPILSCTFCDLGHRNNCCQEVFSAVAGVPDQEGIMPLLSYPYERTDLKHHYGFILALVCMWLASVVASTVVFAAMS